MATLMVAVENCGWMKAKRVAAALAGDHKGCTHDSGIPKYWYEFVCVLALGRRVDCVTIKCDARGICGMEEGGVRGNGGPTFATICPPA